MAKGVLSLTVMEATLLGLIQGLTEFLPVSSSGHLVLTQRLLGITTNNLTFDIIVHLGTLVAVVIALWGDVATLFDGLRSGRDSRILAGRRLTALLIVGTLPTVVIGLAFKGSIEALFTSVYTTGLMLLLTGLILYIAEKVRHGKRTIDRMRLSDALFVGCGQALAVMPGLSRSGTTISAGFIRGLARDDAARFSFLLSIPAIIGAAVLEIPDALSSGSQLTLPAIFAGLISSAVTGYFAITLLVRFVRKGSLKGFAYYTWVAGILALILAFGG